MDNMCMCAPAQRTRITQPHVLQASQVQQPVLDLLTANHLQLRVVAHASGPVFFLLPRCAACCATVPHGICCGRCRPSSLAAGTVHPVLKQLAQAFVCMFISGMCIVPLLRTSGWVNRRSPPQEHSSCTCWAW